MAFRQKAAQNELALTEPRSCARTHMLPEGPGLPETAYSPTVLPPRASSTQSLSVADQEGPGRLRADKVPFFISSEPCPSGTARPFSHCQKCVSGLPGPR